MRGLREQAGAERREEDAGQQMRGEERAERIEERDERGCGVARCGWGAVHAVGVSKNNEPAQESFLRLG
jgi:hypothetical protein